VTTYGIVPYGPVNSGAVARMKPADAKVYLVLCAHVRSKAWEANPSIARIAELTGMSSRSVFRAVNRLEETGLLIVTSGGGRGHTSTYRLTGNSDKNYVTVTPAQTVTTGAINGDNPRQETVTAGARHKDKNFRKNKKNNISTIFPPSLDTENFREAWNRWEAYRREIHKPLTTTTVTAQLKKLSALGPDAAAACIDQSIGHGWRGLFPEEAQNRGSMENDPISLANGVALAAMEVSP